MGCFLASQRSVLSFFSGATQFVPGPIPLGLHGKSALFLWWNLVPFSSDPIPCRVFPEIAFSSCLALLERRGKPQFSFTVRPRTSGKSSFPLRFPFLAVSFKGSQESISLLSWLCPPLRIQVHRSSLAFARHPQKVLFDCDTSCQRKVALTVQLLFPGHPNTKLWRIVCHSFLALPCGAPAESLLTRMHGSWVSAHDPTTAASLFLDSFPDDCEPPMPSATDFETERQAPLSDAAA